MFWDFHESKRYPCTQKISSLALKLTILGLKNFMGKMLILGTPFQPLCTGFTIFERFRGSVKDGMYIPINITNYAVIFGLVLWRVDMLVSLVMLACKYMTRHVPIGKYQYNNKHDPRAVWTHLRISTRLGMTVKNVNLKIRVQNCLDWIVICLILVQTILTPQISL